MIVYADPDTGEEKQLGYKNILFRNIFNKSQLTKIKKYVTELFGSAHPTAKP